MTPKPSKLNIQDHLTSRHGDILLCDLGGVLLNCSFDRAVADWAHQSGVPAEKFVGRFNPHDDCGREFERGHVNADEYWAHLREVCELPLDDDQLLAGWNSIFIGVDRPVERILRRVAARGHRIVAVPNTNVVHEQFWRTHYAESISVFDAIYSSWRLGSRKPDATFFQQVLTAEDVAPIHAAFIDDSFVNVEGARRVGVNAFQYRESDQLDQQLRSFGLL